MFRHKWDHEESEPSLIVAWSLGSLIALTYAITFPKSVKGLVLFSPTSRMTKDFGYEGIAPKILESMKTKLHTNLQEVLRDFALNCSITNNESFIETYLYQALQFSVEELLKGLEYLATTDLRSQLTSIMIPTLIIHGEHDRIVPISQGRYLSERLVQSRLISLPFGHDVVTADPSYYTDELSPFL